MLQTTFGCELLFSKLDAPVGLGPGAPGRKPSRTLQQSSNNENAQCTLLRAGGKRRCSPNENLPKFGVEGAKNDDIGLQQRINTTIPVYIPTYSVS